MYRRTSLLGTQPALYIIMIHDPNKQLKQYIKNITCLNEARATHLEHKHGQFLIVLPLFHGSFHFCRRRWQRRSTALVRRLSVKLCHLLQLLPQVFGNYLSPFCRTQIKPVRHFSTITQPQNTLHFIFIQRLKKRRTSERVKLFYMWSDLTDLCTGQ